VRELETFTLVLPVLVPVLTGWLAVRLRLLASHDAKVLTTAFLHIFLPALIVGNLATQRLAALFDVRFILATASLMAGIYVAIFLAHIFLLRRSLASAALAAFASAKVNTVVVGLPLLLVALGHQAIIAVIINLLIGYFTILPLTLFLLEIARAKKAGHVVRYSAVVGSALRHVALDPLILASVAGLLIAALEVTLPAWLNGTLSVLGSAASGVALVAVGMMLGGASFSKSAGEVLWVSAVRVVVSPILAIEATRVFGLSPFYSVALVISFSLPTAKMAFAVAERYGEYEEPMAEIVTITTLSMVIVYPVFLWICEHFWPGVILKTS